MNIHKIVIIQRVVKQKQKSTMKTANKAFKNKDKIVTEMFWKKHIKNNKIHNKSTYKENIEERDVRICMRKINKN